MKRTAPSLIALLLGTLIAASPFAAGSAQAAVALTLTPITWDVVGLDSNTPASGPNRFPIGARVCATGSSDATAVTATLTWDSANANVTLRAGSLATINLGTIAAGTCVDAYFEAEVNKVAAAYDTARQYHITATSGAVTVSTPRPRQVYVEHLISQNRNGITTVKLDGTAVPAGGSMTLAVGQTYDIELDGYTATQGYNQLESFITLPNTVFRVISVNTTYTADTSAFVANPASRLYADACRWDPDPNSPTYRSCVGGDAKAGGTVNATYRVKIIGGAGTSETLTSLLYDFSGSSFHYNADAGVNARQVSIVGPDSVTIAKSFSPTTITPGGTSTLSFTLTNPAGTTFPGIRVTDGLPAGVTVASPPNASSTGCTPTFSPALAAGASSIGVTDVTLAPHASCVITVDVTATAGTKVNTTNHLFVEDTVDTGKTATATLTASAPAACTPGQTLARWTVPNGTVANPPDLTGGVPTTKAADVATATAAANVPGSTAISATNGQGDSTSWSTYGYSGAGQFVKFTVDTTKYTNVGVSFYAANPSLANGPTSLVLAADAGSGFVQIGSWTNPVLPFTQYTASTTAGQTSTSGITVFRLTATGAKNNNSGAGLLFDDITFTGCREAVPQPTIAKAFSPATVAIGVASTLTFTLANTASGATALAGLAFTDTLPAGLTATATSTTTCGGSLTASGTAIAFSGGALAGGATCTFSVPVTASAAGTYDNVTGFLSSTTGGVTSSYATAPLHVLAPPTLAKAFVPAVVKKGDPTDLQFTLSNPNALTALTGVSFSDVISASLAPLIADGVHAACGGSFTLAAGTLSFSTASLGAGATCSFSVPLSTAATPAGSVPNTTSTVASGNGGTGTAATATLLVANPVAAIGLTKQASTTPGDATSWRTSIGVAVGDPVSYRFSVYNAGDVALDNLAINDPALGDAGTGLVACSWSGDAIPLAPGGTAYCTSGPVSAVSGTHANTATASASSSLGNRTSSPSTATYATTDLTLVKSATEASFTTAGDILHYSYVVTNVGNFPLLGPVTVTDDKSADETCPAVSTQGDLDNYLDPGEHLTCTATYSVTAGDVTAGSVTNTASASADGTTSNSDSATVSYTAPASPSLSITKVASAVSVAAPGPVNYTITVSNTGNVILTGVVVADSLTGGATYASGDIANTGTLDQGEAWVYHATYAVTQADIDAGVTITNTATVVTDQTVSQAATATTSIAQSPSLSVVKSSTTTSITHAGQVVPYTITVTNTGNVDLTTIVVTDPSCTAAPVYESGDTADTSVLDVGEAWVYSCSLTVGQGQVDLGNQPNTAAADSDQTPLVNDTLDIPVAQTPAITVAKASTTASITHAGQVVPYTITVTNSGNVSLTGVTVTDAACSAAPAYQSGNSVNPSILDVGEAWVYACSHRVTQAEMNAGGTLDNTATADTAQTSPVDGSKSIPVAQSPALSIAKTSTTNSITHAGQVVPYTLTVSNDGNVALTSIAVADAACDEAPTLQSGDTGQDGILSVGETWTYTCELTVTQAQVDAGNTLSNTATADSAETGQASDTLDLPVAQHPALAIVKTITSGSKFTGAGDVIAYEYKVTNTGNVTVGGPITVDDDKTAVACPVVASLAPGAFITCKSTYTVTTADVSAGKVTNTAKAIGSFGQSVVASTVMAATAALVVSPTEPPSSTVDPGAIASGPGGILVLFLLGMGLIAFAVTGRPRRRARRR